MVTQDSNAGQAQGLVEQNQRRLRTLHAERALSLLDARELVGDRLRLWNVHGAPDLQALTSSLAERFGDVQWISEPRPGCIWVFSTNAASLPLPDLARQWCSAPVGVLWIEPTRLGARAVKGFEAQEKTRSVLRGFSQVQFLGVLSSPADADLLDYDGSIGGFSPLAWVRHRLARRRLGQLRKQVSIFYKWCMEWRHRHWMQDASIGRVRLGEQRRREPQRSQQPQQPQQPKDGR